jgi:hypothetical protein
MAQLRQLNAAAVHLEAMTAQLGRTYPGPETYTPAAPDDVDEPTPAQPQSRLKGERP